MNLEDLKYTALYDLFETAYDYTIKTNNMYLEDLLDCLFVVGKNKYFKNFIISRDIPRDGSYADFSNFEKTITIYYDAISNKLQNELTECHDRNILIALIYNEFLRCMIHEIEHSKQYTLKDSVLRNGLEKSLLEYSIVNDSYEDYAYTLLMKEGRIPSIRNMQEKIWLLTTYWHNFYDKYYSVVPFERLADIKTYFELEKIYKQKPRFKFLSDFVHLCKLKKMIEDYKLQGNMVLAPTTVFIQNFSKTVFGGSIPFDWYSDDSNICLKNVIDRYDFNKRIFYGLPVTLEEYNRAHSIFNKKENQFDTECRKNGIYVKKL